MKNLIGDDVKAWREILGDPDAKLHLYGKAEARAGRKMGHVTKLKLVARNALRLPSSGPSRRFEAYQCALPG